MSKYVRPLVGTQGEGNTYPGPTAPFGMVQPGPDTNGQKFCGYDHTDPLLHGFSMTHLSGTGWWDLGDFLFMPGTGEAKFDPGKAVKPAPAISRPSRTTKRRRAAGYYKIKLRDYNTWVELTASERAGNDANHLSRERVAWILTDLKHVLHWDTVWSHARIEDNSTITGFHLLHGWAKEALPVLRRPLFPAVRSLPDHQRRQAGRVRRRPLPHADRRSKVGRSASRVAWRRRDRTPGSASTTPKKDEVILVKIAVSAVSARTP